jgi:uncharacterized protein (DUF169 family)
MIDVTTATATLKDILSLTYEPIAVKFLGHEVDLDGFELPDGRHFCQVLMGARESKRLLLTADNVSCPAAAWAFLSRIWTRLSARSRD